MARWSGKSEHGDPWVDWFEGNIYSKNPDPALIDKMLQIARSLNAQVQGDDGEIYRSGYEKPVYPRPSAFDRLRNWWRARTAPRLEPIEPPFRVGDRMLDVYSKEVTILHIDPESNHNMGKVTVRYDDGREVSFALLASGLRPLQSSK